MQLELRSSGLTLRSFCGLFKHYAERHFELLDEALGKMEGVFLLAKVGAPTEGTK